MSDAFRRAAKKRAKELLIQKINEQFDYEQVGNKVTITRKEKEDGQGTKG